MFVNSYIMSLHNGDYVRTRGFIERDTKRISAGGKEDEVLICFIVLYSIYRHLIFCEHKCQVYSRDLWIKCCLQPAVNASNCVKVSSRQQGLLPSSRNPAAPAHAGRRFSEAQDKRTMAK